jgi:hypothetical protein
MARTLVSEIKPVEENKIAQVGDIVHSMLTEAQFQAERDATWVLADGRGVTGTDYETVTASSNIPDLRGRFLRGKNNGRGSGSNPDGEFVLGQEQGQATAINGMYSSDSYLSSVQNEYPVAASTNVTVGVPRSGTSGWTYGGNGTGPPARDRYTNTVTNVGLGGGANETRASNTTVNYFIKINKDA